MSNREISSQEATRKLKNILETQEGFLNLSELTMKDVEYFTNALNQPELKERLNHYKWFEIALSNSCDMLVINLYKMFSKSESDEYSLETLYRYFQKHFHKIDPDNTLTKGELSAWHQKYLDNANILTAISNLKNHRNKFIAHLDPRRNTFEQIKWGDISLLINSARSFLDKISEVIDQDQPPSKAKYSTSSLESILNAIRMPEEHS